MVTCFSPLSRNHFVGECLGKGEKLSDILSRMSAVAEGVPTAGAAKKLSQKYNVETPIMSEIYSILHGEKTVQEALSTLVGRSQKSEQS